MLLMYAVIAAIPIGYLFGGRLRNYLNAPFRLVLLPCLAFLLEAFLPELIPLIPLPQAVQLAFFLCAEYLMLFVFAGMNMSSRGVPLLAAGCFMNFAAISASGFRMPVTPLIFNAPDSAAMAERIQAGEVIRYVLVDWDAPLWFLGDTIPLFGGLASIGDLVMAAALLLIIVFKMKAQPPEGTL